MKLLRTAFLALGLLASPVSAEIVSYYEFPFVDPLEATVIGTPSIYQAELPEIPFENRQLHVFRGRQVPALFWYTEALQYGLSRQPGPAPLAFIIPGTGAGHNSVRTLILQRTLYKAGFHVVALASSIHPNFIVSASLSRRPGLLAEDAKDIYRVMGLIRSNLEGSLRITGYHLAGYSLGAAQAAFVAKLDEERGDLDFERVLLINPPVNLYRSASILDAMFNRNFESVAEFNAFFQRIMSAFSDVYQESDFVDFGSDFLYEVYKRNPPSESTLEALIGLAFRLTSINLLFTSDVMSNSGIIVPRGYDPSPTDALTVYFKIASVFDFADYGREIVYPHYVATQREISFEQLVELTSLRTISDYLASAEKIGLMHNVDDITLEDGDIEYLIEVFGSRAQIYPKGGHCGNLAFRDNVAHVIDFFTN